MPTDKQPLWKQLLGAAVGSVAAVMLYGGYSLAAPHVQSLLAMAPVTDTEAIVESESEPRFSDADRVARQEEIVRRAREAVARMREDR